MSPACMFPSALALAAGLALAAPAAQAHHSSLHQTIEDALEGLPTPPKVKGPEMGGRFARDTLPPAQKPGKSEDDKPTLEFTSAQPKLPGKPPGPAVTVPARPQRGR